MSPSLFIAAAARGVGEENEYDCRALNSEKRIKELSKLYLSSLNDGHDAGVQTECLSSRARPAFSF